MRTIPIALLLLSLSSLPLAPARAAEAIASSGEEDRSAVAVTVYNDGTGLVRELRRLSLPPGIAPLRFEDVAQTVDPTSVSLVSLTAPGRLSVLEQNYEYDLITPQNLLRRSVGSEVTAVRQLEDGRELRRPARLLGVESGPVLEIDGEIHFSWPGQIVLPGVPEGLVPSPTLVWLLENRGPAEQEVEVAYLTGGMSWRADYVLLLDGEDTAADLTGWVTVDNRSGAAYREATLKLVAGTLHRAPTPDRARMKDAATFEAARAPQMAQEGLFEYHLYTLERPTTLSSNQTKQVELLSAAGVPVKKVLVSVGQPFLYRSSQGTRTQTSRPSVEVEWRNEEEAGLGIPFPAGVVRLYKKDRSGAPQFVGEDRIEHIPRDETIRVRAGEAFDVVVERRQTDFRKLNLSLWDVEVASEIRVRNHKDEPATVLLREMLGGQWELVEESREGRRADAGTLEYEVSVPARGEEIVRYRVKIDW